MFVVKSNRVILIIFREVVRCGQLRYNRLFCLLPGWVERAKILLGGRRHHLILIFPTHVSPTELSLAKCSVYFIEEVYEFFEVYLIV